MNASQAEEDWMSTARQVIVGASAAGTAAAHGLRTAGFDGEVVLVDGDKRLPYERPPLSKVRDEDGWLVPIFSRDFYEANGIELRLGVTARSLDAAKRSVGFSDGTSLTADAVLLATGLEPRRLQVPGADLRNLLYLRTATDAERLHERLDQGGPLVIVGGGFIALEVAALARSKGLDVTVVARSLPLRRSVGDHLALRLLAEHQARGVRILIGATVEAVLGAGAVEAVRLRGGQTLPAATVLVGIGSLARTSLAEQAQVRCRGGIVVDSAGCTSNPWVLAAGDIAVVRDRWGRAHRCEHWDSASNQGAVAGAAMAGARPGQLHLPYFWSEQYDLLVQMYGSPQAADQVVRRPGEGGSEVVFWLRGGRLVAAGGIGAARDLRAVRPLLDAAAHVDAAELADPGTRLRDLMVNARGRSRAPAGVHANSGVGVVT